MSLITLSQNCVNSAFKVLKDLVRPLTLRGNPVTNYDTATGNNVTTYTNVLLSGFPTSYDINEVLTSAGSILFSDVCFVLKGVDVDAIGNIDTTWHAILDNEEYTIVPPVVKTVTNATVMLQLRKI